MATLTDLDPDQVPAELKKEGSDWFAIFNPQAQRKLDISLTLSLQHERYALCPFADWVRLADGESLIALCVVCGSQRTGSTSPQGVTRLRRSMIPRPGRRLGMEPNSSQPLKKDALLIVSVSLSSTLIDENATKSGDLYIRSVCFSPDGKLLATGAEDKQIRVGKMNVG